MHIYTFDLTDLTKLPSFMSATVLSAFSAHLRIELNLKMLAGQNLSSIFIRMKND